MPESDHPEESQERGDGEHFQQDQVAREWAEELCGVPSSQDQKEKPDPTASEVQISAGKEDMIHDVAKEVMNGVSAPLVNLKYRSALLEAKPLPWCMEFFRSLIYSREPNVYELYSILRQIYHGFGREVLLECSDRYPTCNWEFTIEHNLSREGELEWGHVLRSPSYYKVADFSHLENYTDHIADMAFSGADTLSGADVVPGQLGYIVGWYQHYILVSFDGTVGRIDADGKREMLLSETLPVNGHIFGDMGAMLERVRNEKLDDSREFPVLKQEKLPYGRTN